MIAIQRAVNWGQARLPGATAMLGCDWSPGHNAGLPLGQTQGIVSLEGEGRGEEN